MARCAPCAHSCRRKAFGFDLVGTYRRVGWKLGRWHDIAWYQRDVAGEDGPSEPPR